MEKNVVDVAGRASYKIAHMTTEKVTNQLTCFKTQFEAGDEVDIQVRGEITRQNKRHASKVVAELVYIRESRQSISVSNCNLIYVYIYISTYQ